MTKDDRLSTAPLNKLMITMAMPAVLAQIINVLYNIVDRIFIGHIEGYGELALTGVGVALPIIMIISAFSAFAGMGGAPLASIELGRKNRNEAEKILGNSLSLLLIFSACLTLVFSIFKEPMLYAFGASDNTIAFAIDYISIYILGTIFVLLSLGLNTYISAQGNPRVAMLSVIIGAISNIILDPIFIFGLNMGVKGAALATIISQALSALWVLSFLRSDRSIIRISFDRLRLDRDIIAKIAALGISPFIMQSTESLVMIILNKGLLKYGGDLYVGTMSIISSVVVLIMAPIQGITQGVQPIISYNYGAKNYERVRDSFMRMLGVSFLISLIMGGLAVFKPYLYANIFSDSQALTDLTIKYMPIYFIGLMFFGIQLACQSTFLALGQARVSLSIALLRKIFLLIPLALILPRFFGVVGIYIAEPIADILSVSFTSLMLVRTFKKLKLNKSAL